jgi:hypothetical protein
VASVGLRIVSFVAYIAVINVFATLFTNMALAPSVANILPARIFSLQSLNIERFFHYTDINLLIELAEKQVPQYAHLFTFLHFFEIKNTVIFVCWALNIACMFSGQTLRMHLFGMTVVHEETGKALDFVWMYTFNLFFLLLWPLDVFALLFTGKSCTERLFSCLIVVTA